MTVMTSRGLSQRAVARGLGLSRAVEPYARKQPGTDAKLSGRIRDLSQQFPRFGYRRIAAWLNVGDKRLWRL
jgi:predicted transcriptional regulator